MTENEAKSKLDSLHYKIIHTSFCNKVYESEIEALCLAKDVLQEIQQYRAIGTIEEFKTLKKKNEPKKIDIWANGEEHCPFCDKNITTFYSFANCFSCGQKLDWQ